MVRKRPYTPEEIDGLLGREVGTTRQRGTWQRGKPRGDLILHLPIAEVVEVGSRVKTARAMILWAILRLQAVLMPKQVWHKPDWLDRGGRNGPPRRGSRRGGARGGRAREVEAGAGRATQYQLLPHRKGRSKADGRDRDPA